MDAHMSLGLASISRALFTWDPKFTKREEDLHKAEDNRVEPDPGQSDLEAFLTTQSHRLQPRQFSYDALRKFLELASSEHLHGSRQLSEDDQRKLVFLDERRDTTNLKYTSRDWSNYAQYPPPGDSTFVEVLDAREFFDRLRLPVCGTCFISHKLTNTFSDSKRLTEV